jgi:UDP-N-acetylmuramate: L-alanyl-gamma-D-glutamyl-meso-diaminopimelate ligase
LPPEIPEIEAIRHVHLVAVAGTGVGTLACMLADRGFRVTGSDVAAYPPMGDQLRAAGIEVQKGFAREHVEAQRPDLVVIGNAVRADNPEARAAIDGGLPYLSFSDAVHHFFIRGKHSVVVAGTHGKTTCTSLIGWILAQTGRDPSLLIGGVARNFGVGFRLGAGDHFVVEGDEYDTAFFDKTPKFLHYAPRTLLLTSCEFDHADIYENQAQIEEQMAKLVALVPEDGCIVAETDTPALARLVERARAPVYSYGFSEEAQWKASDITFDEASTQFNVWSVQERAGRVRVPMHGRHNVENVLGSIALCHALGVPVQESAEALESFEGVRRRQEIRGEVSGVVVMEDFAHHPTAVRETIGAVRARYPDHRVLAVFEPRTNTSRRRFFEDDYVEALSSADVVILAPVHRAEDIPVDERLRPERIVDALAARDVDASVHPDVDDIIEHLLGRCTGKDVALIMSNGEFGGIWDRLLARLEKTGTETR